MRQRRERLVWAAAIVAGSFANASPGQVHGFVYTVPATDCGTTECARVPSSWLSDRPDSALFATSNFNPSGPSGMDFDQLLTVSYLDLGPGDRTQWIFGTDGTNSIVGASFNLLAVGVRPSCVWKHVSSAGNIFGNVTFLDRPSLNGNAAAFLLVQEIGTPPSIHPLGVYYNSGINDLWGIFNQDNVTMVSGKEFWVLDFSCSSGVGAGIIISGCVPSGGWCYLDNPVYLNNRQNAVILVTQRWSFAHQVYNPHPIGVGYIEGLGKWVIFNEDNTPIPANAEFFVGIVTSIYSNNFETGTSDAWSDVVP